MRCWSDEEWAKAKRDHDAVLKAIEDARRLARYDEAIRLLLRWKRSQYGLQPAPLDATLAFLAAEPKEGR